MKRPLEKVNDSLSRHRCTAQACMSRTKFRSTALCIILLVLAYYIWSAASNGVPLVSRITDDYYKTIRSDEIEPGNRQHYGYYNLMTDAFLAGKLSLLISPARDLLELPDPYNPETNAPYRLHDVSLYKGRYYLYFGPVPALLLFLPFRLLPFGQITEPFATALFGFGAFLFSALILVRLARRFTPPVSERLLLFAILALGISNAMPFLLRRPVIYEVAIAAGAFFIMLGFFLLVRNWDQDQPSRQSMALLSLSWGLSAGCRVVYVFAGLALGVIWLLLLSKGSDRRVRTWLLDGIALAFPFGLCLCGLGLYNFVRFDSWTEFGVKYQLAGAFSPPGTMFRFENLIPGLHFNVLRFPMVNFNFPFFHLQTGSSLSLPNNYNSNEPVAGFLLTTPIVLFFCVGFAKRIRSGITPLIGLLTGFGFGTLFFEAFLLPGASMRYHVDFLPAILVAALLLWLRFDSFAPSDWRKSALRCFSVILLSAGMILHMAFGLTGYYDLFKRSNPRAYFALEDFFAPVSRMLVSFSERTSPAILDPLTPAGYGSSRNHAPSQLFFLRFFSPADAKYRLMADFRLNSGLAQQSGVRVRFLFGRSRPMDFLLSEDTHLEWIVPVRRGVHRVEVFAVPVEEKPTIPNAQLVSISNLQLVDEVTGKTVQ